MTNREAIDHVRAWHRGDVHLAEIDPTAMDVVLALAEAQVQRTPQEGAVKVRLAVVMNCHGRCETLDARGLRDEIAISIASQDMGPPTHAAIVHAWIPRVQVPVVEGEVQG